MGYQVDEQPKIDFREKLQLLLLSLDAEDQKSADSRATVILDQQSVGRLSRMGALQQQAMAQATAGRRQQMRQRIAAALLRLDSDDFGICLECGSDIAPKRLQHDPTVALCIECSR